MKFEKPTEAWRIHYTAPKNSAALQLLSRAVVPLYTLVSVVVVLSRGVYSAENGRAINLAANSLTREREKNQTNGWISAGSINREWRDENASFFFASDLCSGCIDHIHTDEEEKRGASGMPRISAE